MPPDRNRNKNPQRPPVRPTSAPPPGRFIVLRPPAIRDLPTAPPPSAKRHIWGSLIQRWHPPGPESAPYLQRIARSSTRAAMPLEVSELFSMAPLSGRSHPADYRIPKNFDLGSGNVRLLQEKLITKFESLASETNGFLEADGRSLHFGAEVFKDILDEAKRGIRSLRDEIVQLMAAIYNLGQNPLPPQKDLDADVSRILNDCCLATAARAATKSVASTSSTAKTTVSQSKSVEAKSIEAKCKMVSASRLNPKTKDAAARQVTSKTTVSQSKSASKPRLISRGAAARARAEAAYDARARAEANARAEEVSMAMAVARARKEAAANARVAAARARMEANTRAEEISRARVAARAAARARARTEAGVNARVEAAPRARVEARAEVAANARAEAAARSDRVYHCSGSRTEDTKIER